ncbi:MAG: pyruvate kinase, partial [Candidatus Thermoplasmatota archaeon]|nr:pyruvate kinase [Candidatus Thermoplasmatota archaeon]
LGTSMRFSTTYPELPKMLRKGNSILLDDGLLQLEVEEIRGGEVHCRVLKGGFLSDGKGMNIPDSTSRNVGLSDKDREDLAFGLGLGVDYVAVSFVTSAAEVEEVREIIRKEGARTGVIAKIEKPGAIEHLDDIVEAADGLMIARGDLGVEIPLEDLPGVQKRIISTCRRYGKPVITATQMLQSMVENRIPTRAEVLDIANAVDDGTDALMLSAETASGKHPVESIEYMARIASKVEKESPRQDDREQDICGQWQISNAVGRAACELGEGLGAKAILAFTMSGSTARLISKHRRPTPVFAATADEAVMRQMSLYWGVRPVFMEMVPTTEKMFAKVEKTLLELGLVAKDDLVVITAGVPLSMTGRTNLIKVHRVGSGHWK